MELEKEQKLIVEKSLEDRIIVNAAPGTGKTETIIQKLIYIAQEEITDLQQILVICFSRAAVKEIRNRVDELTGFRNRVEIRTIDSFCSMIIRIMEDNYKKKFNEMGYDDRIKYVIKLLERDTRIIPYIKYYKHIIIDEFQDIVGNRAEFIMELLKVYRNGFTILGDECQAIFNYQADQMTSDKLIEEIQKEFPDVEKIELSIQHRETNPKQRTKNNICRTIIKRNKDKPDLLNQYLKKMIIPSIEIKKIDTKKNNKVAILARQNGEVYEIIKDFNHVIPYQIQEYSNYIVFPAWIGYVFYDYEKRFLKKEKFISIIKDRLHKDDAEKYWDYCKEIENIGQYDDINEYEIDLNKFKENLIIDKGEYPKNFEKEDSNLIISTIHKAKGREYDEVYIHVKNNEFIQKKNIEMSLDNARILYVAMTRAKNTAYRYERQIENILFQSYRDKEKDRYYCFNYSKKGKIFKYVTKIEVRLRRRH